MRGAPGEFGAPGSTLLKAGGEIFNSGTGTGTCLGLELADRWRVEGDLGWGVGVVARWASSPGTWEAREERSCRQHGDRGAEG